MHGTWDDDGRGAFSNEKKATKLNPDSCAMRGTVANSRTASLSERGPQFAPSSRSRRFPFASTLGWRIYSIIVDGRWRSQKKRTEIGDLGDCVAAEIFLLVFFPGVIWDSGQSGVWRWLGPRISLLPFFSYPLVDAFGMTVRGRGNDIEVEWTREVCDFHPQHVIHRSAWLGSDFALIHLSFLKRWGRRLWWHITIMALSWGRVMVKCMTRYQDYNDDEAGWGINNDTVSNLWNSNYHQRCNEAIPVIGSACDLDIFSAFDYYCGMKSLVRRYRKTWVCHLSSYCT